MNILFLLLAALPSFATEVTVYNDDLGLIKDVRPLSLKVGWQDISIVDVAARIDATSVHLKSLTAPDSVSVLEQNFQYDLISTQKLMERYLGKEIELERMVGTEGRKERVRGTLLSVSGGTILKSDGKILINPGGSPILPDLPEGLLTKPTLLWKLSAKKGGTHDAELSYLTAGMSWRSDYVVVASPNDDKMDLNAWVTINNNSGATYKDAKLKLVAGDVNRVREARYPMASALGGARMKAAEMDGGFQERGFFEYHLYALQRPSTLRDNEQKQIELASAADVPLKKLFIYDGAQGWASDYNDWTRTASEYGVQSNKKVAVMLEFKNAKSENLGMPLPKGRVRVYKKDADGSLAFVGEDNIDHTPKDELVRVKMGEAFDVVGERRRTDFKLDTKGRWAQESFEIKLRNHKDAAVTVRVVEHLYRWNEWKLVEQSQKHEKKDAQTIEFQLQVPKDGEAVLSYTVKYSW